MNLPTLNHNIPERRKSERVSLPVKIHILRRNSLPVGGKRNRTILDSLIDRVNVFRSKDSEFVGGELEDISSGGALIKIKKDGIQKLSSSGLFFWDGNYMAVSCVEPLKVELKTPSGAHITTCDFYIKRLKISGDYLYIGGEFARCDGRKLLPMPLPTDDTRNALIISW